MRKGRRRAAYWSRERVIASLQSFARSYGYTPTSSDAWSEATKGTQVRGNAPGNPFPSFATVLRHFPSFRAAWTAGDVPVNRGDEPWARDEEWFISEACGLISRDEMAAYLDRTPNAVHRRLYDLGIDSRKARGWTVHRAMVATGVADHVIRQYIERGELPYLRGVACAFIDPADLLVVREIDWDCISEELEAAIRRSLMARLVTVISGGDWRAASPYKAEVARVTTRRWNNSTNRQQTMESPPYRLKIGEWVQLTVAHPLRPGLRKRQARVKSVYFSRTRQVQNGLREGLGACWVARVEYTGDGLPRVNATIPLVYLKPPTRRLMETKRQSLLS